MIIADQHIMARVFSHLDLGPDKFRLRLVCKVWQEAMRLPAAHPVDSLCLRGHYRWPMMKLRTTFLFDVSSDFWSLTLLNMPLQYFRLLRSEAELPNLLKLEICSTDEHDAPILLPKMPLLQEIHLTIADQSGKDLMQNRLCEMPSLRKFTLLSEYEASYDFPVIKAPSMCEVAVLFPLASKPQTSMLDVPMTTAQNLTVLQISLLGNIFPDFRGCRRLRRLDIFVEARQSKILMRRTEFLPESLHMLTLHALEESTFIVVEDRDGFCQFRDTHPENIWCTYVFSRHHKLAFGFGDQLYSDYYDSLKL